MIVNILSYAFANDTYYCQRYPRDESSKVVYFTAKSLDDIDTQMESAGYVKDRYEEGVGFIYKAAS